MVIPFDVTTKDDLFYHISCDYNDEKNNFEDGKFNKNNQNLFVRSGVIAK